MQGLVTGDTDAVVEVLLDWREDEEIEVEANPARLRSEIDAFVDQYKGVPLKRLDLGEMLSDLVTILRENQLVLPTDLSLLIKAFITLEGMGRQLDPDFDIATEAAPFLQRVMLAHQSPPALARRSWRTVSSAVDMLAGLPQDASQLLRAARRGKLRVEVDVVPLKHFGDRIDRATSRLTIGIVTASLIIGSSIVMTVASDSIFGGLSTWGLLGFIGAVLGGIWVLISIRRGGKD